MINFSKFACLIFTALVMLLTGCGSGGSEIYGPVVTPPSINLIGKYNLTTFRVEFSDGTTYNPSNLNVSGTMIIDDSYITQNLTIEGNPLPPSSGQYTVTFTNADKSQGILTITGNTGTYDVSFTITGLEVETYSGINEVNPSVTVEEWDTWRKISDVPQAPPLAGRSETEDGYWWIFKSLGP